LSDGIVWQDQGGAFGVVPRTLWQQAMPADGHPQVPLALHALLVRSQGKTILVETGLGSKLDEPARASWGLERPRGGLLDSLARVGVSAQDVDIVINTHLHADHCGGNTELHQGTLRATFPRAHYWVQRLEWADASLPDERTRKTYLPANFVPLGLEGRLQLLHGDAPVTGQVRCVVTRGHTRGHQSVVVEMPGRPLLFTGDMATFGVHFAHLNWLTAYDVEPLETLRSKRRWRAWAAASDAVVVFAHDRSMPAATVHGDDRRLRLSAFDLHSLALEGA
jgi:glyoxylase-like metal-dependent hydrolase (beta-lactamase superfamily II)